MVTSINRLKRFFGLKVPSANLADLPSGRREQILAIYSQLRFDMAAAADISWLGVDTIEFDYCGRLKPGLHKLCWSDLERIYGRSKRRLWLLEGMRRVLDDLKLNGCRQVYIGGSFVSEKISPNDFDLIYDLTGMSIDAVLEQAPLLCPRSNTARRLQIEQYGGQALPLCFSPELPSLLEFMLYDDRFDEYKGVVVLTL